MRSSIITTTTGIACVVALLTTLPPLKAQITTRTDGIGKQLNEWYAIGDAAGLQHLSYENRDGGHSTFPSNTYPQITVLQPTQEEIEGKRNIGPAQIIRPTPVIGNCSMAAPVDKGGSLPRFYLTSGNGMAFLANQYLNNNLLIYPEHLDYDPGYHGRPGWGDQMPANTPYILISQGSSFTDIPFVQAMFSAASALPRETQEGLIQGRILMPVLQSIFRRSYNTVQQDEDYFTGKAHPPVFEGSKINEDRMIRLAHDMTPARVPPVPLLEVINEDTAKPGVDFFELPGIQNEQLGTTPCSIARIFRGSKGSRQMIVSAKRSADIMKRNLTYRWVLLQGDPARVKIEPSEDGSEARITVQWHPEWELKPDFTTHRVDIGLFVSNGFAWSAPAFISYYMLPNEQRFYDEQGRLQEIFYDAGNPDLGLPADNDLRWLSLAHRLTDASPGVGYRMLNTVLREDIVVRLKSIAKDLAPAQAKWRNLQSDPALKGEADAAMLTLQAELSKRLQEPPTTGGKPLVESVKEAVSRLADEPQLYIKNQQTIQDLLSDVTEANRKAFAESLQLAQSMLALTKKQGRFALHYEPEKLSGGEHYQLRMLNLSMLVNVLLADFLERTDAHAYVDDRLAFQKTWRDVYTTQKDGTPAGWSRITNGRVYEFNQNGQLLPNGRNQPAKDVRYVVGPNNRRLVFSAVD